MIVVYEKSFRIHFLIMNNLLKFRFRQNQQQDKLLYVNCNWTCQHFRNEILQKLNLVIDNFDIYCTVYDITSIHPVPNDDCIGLLNFININNDNFIYNNVQFTVRNRHERPTTTATPTATSVSTMTCSICFTRQRSLVFMPCRHLACCSTCGVHESIIRCVLCRESIQNRLEIFF